MAGAAVGIRVWMDGVKAQFLSVKNITTEKMILICEFYFSIVIFLQGRLGEYAT